MLENGTKVAHIGGACFSTEVPVTAMAFAETHDGKFVDVGGVNKLKIKDIHIIVPLVAEGEIIHERTEVEYRCEATPIMMPNIQLSKYPKLVTEDLAARIYDIACMCAPQEFARMHEEDKVVRRENHSLWGLDYHLVYTFNLKKKSTAKSQA